MIYSSPTIGGFSADISYGFGEVAGNTSAGRYIGASAGYGQGPLFVRLATQSSNDATATGSAKNTMLGATYDIGVAKVHAALAASKTDAVGVKTVDARDAMIGVSAPLGRGKILASYIRRDDRLPIKNDASQVGVGYEYYLSQRTTLYTAYARINNKNTAAFVVGNATEVGSGDKAFNLGIRHGF